MLQPVQREIQRVETFRDNGECCNAFVFSQLTSSMGGARHGDSLHLLWIRFICNTISFLQFTEL